MFDTNSSVFSGLQAQGLNLVAVFSLADLPQDVLDALGQVDATWCEFRQLILIGHLGGAFWDALQRRGMHGAHPVDQFTTEQVAAWMKGPMQGRRWRLVFPGAHPVGLQRLGALAGWHQVSPLGVGVDAQWGSWFAYRAVVLADTDLAPTPRREAVSPCGVCVQTPCLGACPARALDSAGAPAHRLQRCLAYRSQPGSACQDRCLARLACPAGAAHRYADAQVAYHYLHSLRAIREGW